MKKYKIAVAGTGYVGLSIAREKLLYRVQQHNPERHSAGRWLRCRCWCCGMRKV